MLAQLPLLCIQIVQKSLNFGYSRTVMVVTNSKHDKISASRFSIFAFTPNPVMCSNGRFYGLERGWSIIYIILLAMSIV